MFGWLNKLFGSFRKEIKATEISARPGERDKIYESKEEEVEIHSLWDFLKTIENTQAHHILSILGFSEWITMEEIKRRVKEIFGIEYTNDRSLYPYIKTLVDIGLLESINVGGKRKWRKKDLIIKLKKKKEEKKEVVVS
ncbi:hypothetical protein KJ660_03530, partial [Candidatus Micrarchaeota archaeon]|nr:hypothetical protein [Candidatus Micrarchaeota archaeon]